MATKYRFEVRSVVDGMWGTNAPHSRKDTLRFLAEQGIDSRVRRRLTAATKHGHAMKTRLGCNLVAVVDAIRRIRT